VSIEDKNFLLKFTPLSTHGNDFQKLVDELSTTYTYNMADLNNILLDKIVKDTNELAAGRTSGCGDGCCMHKAMAAYYNMRAGGMSSDLADIYMYGYYVGCMQ
jgi:hypothetical protein